MPDIGHNQPPDMTATALETMRDISAWMAEAPIIQTEDTAREAKVYIDRGKLCLKDMDDERTKKVGPLNEEVKKINAYYKAPATSLEGVLAELQQRVTNFIKAEETKRIEAANEAQRIADLAEQQAREAERLEQDALKSASLGELGVDVQAHVVEADSAFRAYAKAERAAALAAKETHVKIGGGFSRAISLRQKEELVVVNAEGAVAVLGATEYIQEAIIKSARAYRKLHGNLPTGVIARITEEI